MAGNLSWKAEGRKIYEERVLNDALARLARQLDLKNPPLSGAELKTLARRARESFLNPEKHADRLARFKAHLAQIHGVDPIEKISAALVDINNEIGYEEK